MSQEKKKWYQEFFTKYYLPFLGHKKTSLDTKRETEFICCVLNLPKNAKILDLACGPGRHVVELAKKKLNKVDFRIVKVFGGYKAQRYNPKTSSRMIILSKKVS